MKKLTYIANSRIPTKFAYGVQIMKMCEAFANEGVEVELVLPTRWQKIKEDPFTFYGVKRNFKIKKLWTLDLVRLKIPGFFIIEVITFGFSVMVYLFLRRERGVLYTRGEMVRFLSFFSKKYDVYWESHNKPDSIDSYKNVLKKVRGVVVLTDYYKNELINDYGVIKNKVLTAHDGVDENVLKNSISKLSARESLNLPKDKKIILYAGSDVPWKGLDVLRSVAESLPENYEIYFIGNIQEKDTTGGSIHFEGFKKPKDIPTWLAAADVLVATELKGSDIANHYTSPLKVFEYMSSGVPIVASDTLAIREVLNEDNAYLVRVGDVEAMKKGIQSAIEDPARAQKLAHRARFDVQSYTWRNRVKAIINLIESTK